MTRRQLVVVGAGPAGSYAALTAARNGLDVLLVERDQTVGLPLACAEAVSQYGFTMFVQPDPAFIATEINALAFTVSNGFAYRHQFDCLVGYVLDRPKFDHHLAEMAVAAGAELACGTNACAITITPEGPATITLEDHSGRQAVTADYIIAADGAESMIGRLAGIDTGLKLGQSDTTLQYRVTDIDVDPHCLEFVFGRTHAPGGYLWVFPKSSRSANVGLGFNPARYAGHELRPRLERFLEERYGSYRAESQHCGLVPKYVGSRILGRENLLLAGDAARTLDSATGAGITKALHTGKLAAAAVAAAVGGLSRPAMQRLYRQTVDDQVGRELRFCQKIYPAMRKFTDEDWETLIRFMRGFMEKEKTGSRIDPVTMVKSAFASAPRLLKLARHIV